MRPIASAPGVVLAATLLLTGACSGPPQPSVILITLDTLRADRLGVHGHDGGLTPRLDALADEGVSFVDATAPAPITLPSHASLFTGRYPLTTGVRNNGTFVLPETEVTLAEVLRQAGWATGAVIGAFPLKRRFGTAQGFEIYDDAIPAPRAGADGSLPVHFPERTASEVTELGLRVWQSLGDGPRLLWVHYFDPHAPYAPPPDVLPGPPDLDAGDEIAAQKRRYDGEVAYTDREVGRLLERILADEPDAIVVVASDHGEALGDHGEKTHGVFLYQSTLHVPLLIRAPGLLPAGRRVEEPVSLVDVLPTVLSLLGLDRPADLDGEDLGGLIGGRSSVSRPVYAESLIARLDFRFAELRALRDGPLKYIDAPAPELYDLAVDPGETTNLFAGHPAAAREAETLAEFVVVREVDEATSSGAVSVEDLARLRSLGYVAGAASESGAERGRDPKEMVGYFARHDRALGAISEGRTDEGLNALRSLIPEAPENIMIPYQIAAVLLAAGRPAEAEAEAARLVERDPTFAGGHLLLGEARFAVGKIETATRSHERAAELLPDSGEPHAALGDQLRRFGRFDQAAAAYRRAIEREPRRADLASRLLELRISRGDAALAADELSELAARHPGSAALWTAAGNAHHRAGSPDLAERAFRRALQADPSWRQAQEGLARLSR